MAIYNLAGNFQPSPVSSGKDLPPNNSLSDAGRVAVTATPKIATEKIQQASPTGSINSKDTGDTGQELTVKQEVIKDQIKELQEFNQNIDRSLQFKVDEELGVTIVRVIDKETEELIRQFPPEELINLSRRLKDLNEQQAANSGVLLQEKV